jgi:hypothetical protein
MILRSGINTVPLNIIDDLSRRMLLEKFHLDIPVVNKLNELVPNVLRFLLLFLNIPSVFRSFGRWIIKMVPLL